MSIKTFQQKSSSSLRFKEAGKQAVQDMKKLGTRVSDKLLSSSTEKLNKTLIIN